MRLCSSAIILLSRYSVILLSGYELPFNFALYRRTFDEKAMMHADHGCMHLEDDANNKGIL